MSKWQNQELRLLSTWALVSLSQMTGMCVAGHSGQVLGALEESPQPLHTLPSPDGQQGRSQGGEGCSPGAGEAEGREGLELQLRD